MADAKGLAPEVALLVVLKTLPYDGESFANESRCIKAGLLDEHGNPTLAGEQLMWMTVAYFGELLKKFGECGSIPNIDVRTQATSKPVEVPAAKRTRKPLGPGGKVQRELLCPEETEPQTRLF